MARAVLSPSLPKRCVERRHVESVADTDVLGKYFMLHKDKVPSARSLC